jgi:protein-L-isoaspartate(D-aspartate) O-methyltransferase
MLLYMGFVIYKHMPETELLELVDYLKRTGYLSSEKVRDALLALDRAVFVPKEEKRYAYADLALPIGHGQTISAPSVVSLMLEKLDIKMGMKVLEVGTGSGYNCALLSKLVGDKGKVISIDIVPELIEHAKENIENAINTQERKPETVNWKLVTGDGSCGYENDAPYDRIIVTAAMPYFNVDHPLAKQLTGDGKLIAPLGSRMYQDLILYDKKSGKIEKFLPVMFVPLIGKHGFEK